MKSSRVRKTTHGLLAKAFERVPDVVDDLLRPFGVKRQTVISWARPKASDDEPFGTGKGNPLDRVDKLIEEIHGFDPAMAREIAEYFSLRCDELDWRRGFDDTDEDEHPCHAIARVVERNAQLIMTSLGGCDNPRLLSECLDKAQKLKTDVNYLIGCLKKALSNNDDED